MRSRLLVVTCLAALLLLSLPAVASAWANGPDYGNGFGTHDWILAQAERFAASKGDGWVNLRLALPHTDDPDMVFHDFYYHVYDHFNGQDYGNAPLKVSSWYAKALKDRKAKKWNAASTDVGILAHYLGDICQPMHTDQTTLENTVHAPYEDAVDNITVSASSVTNWVHFSGYEATGNVQSFAIGLATASHKDYSALVHGFASGGWANPTVQAITKRSLNRATNALADVIIGLRKAAPGGGSSGGGGGGGGGTTQSLASVSGSVSNSSPAQYASVSAYAKCKDSAGKAIPGVSVTFSWHYKTTTPSETLASDSSGVATCTRSIGRATAGYRVSISISANYKGVTRTTSTGFTPR